VLQYFLSTMATALFLRIDGGKAAVLPSQESIVWTLTTQVAGAASAVLFYSAIRGSGLGSRLKSINCSPKCRLNMTKLKDRRVRLYEAIQVIPVVT